MIKLTDAKWFQIFLCLHCKDTIFQSLLTRSKNRGEIELQQGIPDVQFKPPDVIDVIDCRCSLHFCIGPPVLEALPPECPVYQRPVCHTLLCIKEIIEVSPWCGVLRGYFGLPEHYDQHPGISAVNHRSASQKCLII